MNILGLQTSFHGFKDMWQLMENIVLGHSNVSISTECPQKNFQLLLLLQVVSEIFLGDTLY